MLKKKKPTNFLLILGSGGILLFGGISMYQVLMSSKPTSTSFPTAAAVVPKVPVKKIASAVVAAPTPVIASIPVVEKAIISQSSGAAASLPVLSTMPKVAPALPGNRKPAKDDSPEPAGIASVVINIVPDEKVEVHTEKKPKAVVSRTKEKAKPVHKVEKAKPTQPVVKVVKPSSTEIKAPAAVSPKAASDVKPAADLPFAYVQGKVKEVVSSSQAAADPAIKYDLKEGKAVVVKKPIPIHATSSSVWVKLDATRTIKVNQGDNVEGLGVYQGMVDGKVKFNGQLLPLNQ